MRDAPLTEEELASALSGLPTWYVESAKLTTRVELPSFLEAIAFVRAVAEIAEDLDHHPDIDIRWRTVVLAVSTHDSGNAITRRDIGLATRVDAIARAH
ncbi:MAG: phhB [Frankiales bacterium]|nr:phhB [Frankiales bacterium]